MRISATARSVVLTLLVGCSRGPSVESVVFAPAPSSPREPAIRLYRNTLPRCSFEEIGLVSARGGTLDQLATALRVRAHEMGGQAIVGLAQAEHASPGSTAVTTTVPDSGAVVSVASFSVSRITVLSGTVIRFLEPGCQS